MSAGPVNVDPAVASMEQRLAALEPEVLQVYDESISMIVSARFDGQSRVARHRMVYQVLGEMMQKEIHALAITALTPEELREVLPG